MPIETMDTAGGGGCMYYGLQLVMDFSYIILSNPLLQASKSGGTICGMTAAGSGPQYQMSLSRNSTRPSFKWQRKQSWRTKGIATAQPSALAVLGGCGECRHLFLCLYSTNGRNPLLSSPHFGSQYIYIRSPCFALAVHSVWSKLRISTTQAASEGHLSP